MKLMARYIYVIAAFTAEITVDTRRNAESAKDLTAAVRQFGKNASWVCWIFGLASEIAIGDRSISHACTIGDAYSQRQAPLLR